jgi:mono/diheme cytochrome c family protein
MRPARLTPLHAVLAAAIATGASAARAQDLSLAVRRGELLASAHCAMCHSIDRFGTSPNVAAPAFRELIRRSSLQALTNRLSQGRLSGHPEMPEFVLSPSDAHAIISYIEAIQQP